MQRSNLPQPEATQFAEHIEVHEDQIFLRWRDRVKKDGRISSADTMTFSELRDHLPEILSEFCALLRDQQDSEAVADMKEDAEGHGKERWEQGYSLKDVLLEIDRFREILLVDALDDYLEKNPHISIETRLQIEHMGYEFFKQTGMASVIEFTESQNAIMRAQREKLDEANEKLSGAVKKLRAQKAQVQEMSLKDALTGIANRRHLEKRLNRDIQRAQRYNEPLTVVMMDLDHFKDINDTWGHDVGDQVLVAIANYLKEHLRSPDFIARYGGEEFSLVLPETGLGQAKQLVARILGGMSEVIVAPVDHAVTGSFGLAQWVAGEDVRAVLAKADEAMYEAKNRGRNRMVLDEELSSEAGDGSGRVSGAKGNGRKSMDQ